MKAGLPWWNEWLTKFGAVNGWKPAAANWWWWCWWWVWAWATRWSYCSLTVGPGIPLPLLPPEAPYCADMDRLIGDDMPPIPLTLLCLRRRALRLLNQTCVNMYYSKVLIKTTREFTCILASVRPVDRASSSLVYTSGYWVRANARSKPSSCSPENVVLDRRCLRFREIPGSDSMSLESDDRPTYRKNIV